MECMNKVQLMLSSQRYIVIAVKEALKLDADLFSVLQMLSWNHFSRARASKLWKDSSKSLLLHYFVATFPNFQN